MDKNQQPKTSQLRDVVNLPFVNYEPAALKEWPTGWQIEYRVLNPDTNCLEKKRMRFEKIRKRLGDDKARRYAKTFCKSITEKLESGWNPFLEVKSTKRFHKLTDAMDAFMKVKKLDYKNGTFSDDSLRTYKSQIDMFTVWLRNKGMKDIFAGHFNKDHANEYLDYVYEDKEVSPRTWNNYLTFLRALWTWLVSKNYCSENIFANIKPKSTTKKKRKTIPADWTPKIMEFFRERFPNMEVVCGLIYNSFLRPKEICLIQIKDIHLSKNAIYLDETKAKNNTARWCYLPPHLIRMIVDMGIDRIPPDYYLFSSYLEPGRTHLNTRKLDKYWNKMRESIGLPAEMQLYSYRDTGITDLKTQGYANIFIASITGHLNSDEIETYTHEPDPEAVRFIMEKSKRL